MYFRDLRRDEQVLNLHISQMSITVMYECSARCPTRFAGTLVNMTRYPSFPAFCFDMIIYLGVSLSTQLISMFGAAQFLPIYAKRVAIDNPFPQWPPACV